jgi:hypothetical protein
VVDATGGVLIQVVPAVEQQLGVQTPVQIPKAVVLVDLRFVGYPPQEVGFWCSDPSVSGRSCLCGLRTSVMSFPL